MTGPSELTPADAAAIAALADGRLDEERRTALEARLGSEPALAEALAQQRAAVNAVAAAAAKVHAPAALRARIEAMRAEAAAAPAEQPAARTRTPVRPRPAPRINRPQLRRWLPIGALAAAAALIVALVVPSGGPTVGDALAAAVRPPTAPATPDPAVPALLRDAQDGVRFPDYAKKFGWLPTGTRTDRIGGRATRTVFYRSHGRTIAYTIVSGDRLPEPAGTAAAEGGVQLITFRSGGRTVVTWVREGHTCVLSASGVDTQTLRTLAAWKGKGAVRF